MPERRKRLIEVDFPLKEVSAHSRPEKNAPPGHISMVHVWWARRPLAACRAFIYASLVDDPETDEERQTLNREVADLASWDAVRHPNRVVRGVEEGGSGLTGLQLLERARRRILKSNNNQAPKLLDPFAGGGAIPLEALRLGCEIEATDLNPVAVLILKGTLEYPQRYGQPGSRDVPDYILSIAEADNQAGLGEDQRSKEYQRNPLAADIRYWGQWILDRARGELAELYPADADGRIPIAYLWSRTIRCPSCEKETPLIRQYWLSRKEKKKVALEPVIDREGGHIDFRVVAGSNIAGNPSLATTSRGDVKCLLCSQTVKAAQVRAVGLEGKMSARLTSVVLVDGEKSGKHYREDTIADLEAYLDAANRLARVRGSQTEGDLPVIPDEPLPRRLTGGVISAFGFDEWGKLFNDRQLLALTTFSRLVREAHDSMRDSGVDEEHAKAVATFLGLAVDRLANHNSALSRWEVSSENLKGTFARQALPMVWDYAEACPIGEKVGSWSSLLSGMKRSMGAAVADSWRGRVFNADAALSRTANFDIVVTDPPYYDSISYADLSDYFYVWLKRSIGFLYPDLLHLPLTPKREQAIMNVNMERAGTGRGRKDAARQHYVERMGASFRAMAQSLEPGGITGVVFAHTDPDAWSTLIEGLLSAGLVPSASWPIDTELQNKVAGQGQARLSTSVWMVCRKQDPETKAFVADVLDEMRPIIRERLLYFWRREIRGADFFISAIGPALSVFGQHLQVLNPDGSAVTVRDFIDIVRRESTAVALEQILQGSDLGAVDSVTRNYVTWVWSYSRAALDAGETLALCLATGARLDEVTRDYGIAATGKQGSKKVVKLRTIVERARDDDDLGAESSGLTAPLIDQLQCAAWLWSQNHSDRLRRYRGKLGETRWSALLTLGQAVAECLPEGDADWRIIRGLLGATVRAVEAPSPNPQMALGLDNDDATR